MRVQRCTTGMLLVVLVLLAAACAATTAVGKAKEGLLYDREVAIALMAEGVKLHAAKVLSDANYAKLTDAYTKYAAAHNAAVAAIQVVQATNATGGTVMAKMQTSLAASSGLLSEFLTVATAFGLTLAQ